MQSLSSSTTCALSNYHQDFNSIFFIPSARKFPLGSHQAREVYLSYYALKEGGNPGNRAETKRIALMKTNGTVTGKDNIAKRREANTGKGGGKNEQEHISSRRRRRRSRHLPAICMLLRDEPLRK